MPFCEECDPPYWGANCDKSPLDAISEDEFTPWSEAIPYLPQAVLLISIILLMAAIFCGLRFFFQMAGCPGRQRRGEESAESESFDSKIHVQRAPPPYTETMITTDPPPPYTL